MRPANSPTDPIDLWQQIRHMIAPAARARVGRIVFDDAQELAALFYERMLSDPALSPVLNHDLVNKRLNGSMVTWLRGLFEPESCGKELASAQRRIGEVHARIGISHTSVASAGRVLKRAIAKKLRSDAAAEDAAGELQYTYELIDLAIDTMTDSLSSATARLTRSDESYRLFFLTQNLRSERERQRTHLLEWIQHVVQKHYWEDTGADHAEAAAQRPSQFELWVAHKASMLFEGAAEFQALRDSMTQVNQSLLPRLRDARDRPSDARAIVARIHQEAAEMKQLLGTLFDRASAADEGRDHLTRLLNRRYFPAIAKREIALSQSGGRPFALVLVDIDRFSEVIHALGATAADLVLAQLADAVSESVRASDFVFRVGDDKFLILLVDTDPASALEVAQGVREAVASLSITTTAEFAPHLTISAGMATFEGHPDYEHLLRRAEVALGHAKAQGRNRVVVASEDA